MKHVLLEMLGAKKRLTEADWEGDEDFGGEYKYYYSEFTLKSAPGIAIEKNPHKHLPRGFAPPEESDLHKVKPLVLVQGGKIGTFRWDKKGGYPNIEVEIVYPGYDKENPPIDEAEAILHNLALHGFSCIEVANVNYLKREEDWYVYLIIVGKRAS